jgi:hypothetical protein
MWWYFWWYLARFWVFPAGDTTMSLTDVQVRNARYNSDGAGNRLADGGRMYLQLDKSGAKYWRMNFRFAGKDKTLALGVYPDVSLAAARKKRDEAREKLAAGLDPSNVKRLEKRAARLAAANSFEAVARGWMDERKGSVEPAQHVKTLARMENDVFPCSGLLLLDSAFARDGATDFRGPERLTGGFALFSDCCWSGIRAECVRRFVSSRSA